MSAQPETHIDDRILRIYALRGALSVPGVIRHSSGINRFTGRSLPRAEIRWDGDHRTVTVDVQIAVSWPSPVVDIATRVRDVVSTWVTDTTGIPVPVVNVEVSAVVPGDGPVTSGDVAACPEAPDLEPVSATPLSATSPEVTRTVAEPAHPETPEPVPLTPVHAGRPQQPTPVYAPEPVTLTAVEVPPHVPATHPQLPERTPLVPVVAPEPMKAHVPDCPPAPQTTAVSVNHRDVTTPPVLPGPAARGVLRDVPTPSGPQLENVPTPQGLPVRTVPTPRGLPVSVYPTVSRRGLTPVTVQRHPRITVSVPERDAGRDGRSSGQTQKGDSDD